MRGSSRILVLQLRGTSAGEGTLTPLFGSFATSVAMECMYCAGERETTKSIYTIDREGYHLFTHHRGKGQDTRLDPAHYERQVVGFPGYGKADLGDWTKLMPGDVLSKVDVLTYCDHIDGRVSELVKSTAFEDPSGFHWLKFSKAEAHLYNLRHIQHHAGQLIDRLRQEADIGSKWVFDGR